MIKSISILKSMLYDELLNLKYNPELAVTLATRFNDSFKSEKSFIDSLCYAEKSYLIGFISTEIVKLVTFFGAKPTKKATKQFAALLAIWTEGLGLPQKASYDYGVMVIKNDYSGLNEMQKRYNKAAN